MVPVGNGATCPIGARSPRPRGSRPARGVLKPLGCPALTVSDARQNVASMERAEVGGLSIAYRQAGSGPAVVLLHGFSHDSRVWRPQLDGLSGRFRLIAWDAPGAGESADPPEAFEIGDWADALARLLDAIEVPAGHVLGVSCATARRSAR
jgi:alpha/beta hydrolase fold